MANRTWILLAECYANACIAQQLTQRLHGKVRHTPLYGRDKIVKKAVRMAQILNARVILVIDYERGNARRYIDINFHLNQIGEGIHVGRMAQHNILAVVFDPNIEEALICKHIRCTEEVMAELKGPHACNHIMHIATIQQKVETIYMSLLSQTA